MADGIAFPLRNASVWAPVQRHNAGAVNHLVENHDGAGSLEELNIVIVGAGSDRRSGIGTDEAALAERPVFPGVGVRMSYLIVAVGNRSKLCLLLSFRC